MRTEQTESACVLTFSPSHLLETSDDRDRVPVHIDEDARAKRVPAILSSRRALGGPASHTTVRTGHVHGGSREVKTQLSRSRTALVGRFEREKAELDEVVVGERLL